MLYDCVPCGVSYHGAEAEAEYQAHLRHVHGAAHDGAPREHLPAGHASWCDAEPDHAGECRPRSMSQYRRLTEQGLQVPPPLAPPRTTPLSDPHLTGLRDRYLALRSEVSAGDVDMLPRDVRALLLAASQYIAYLESGRGTNT